MKQKWPIFAGILFLTLGIIFRMMHMKSGLYVPFFALGGTLKTYYLGTIIRHGKYKPGWELLSLIVGLTIFFTGVILKNSYHSENYLYWMAVGLALKVLFVILFILKIKKYNKT